MPTQHLISNIQRFSVDDGPGIRTTVFFKGCNLKCLWCHNPECISHDVSLQFMENCCTLCGKCAAVCPNGVHVITPQGHQLHREKCQGCGACEKACRNDALTVVGKHYTYEELLKIIKKDLPYYETSDGGVTFSGGEPMLQGDYLVDMLRICKEAGLHTAVDTAGNVPYEEFEKVLPYTDIFLYDVKLFDSKKHQQATGVPNERILENLKKLSKEDTHIFIRTPIIMEINGDLEELDKIAAFLAPLDHIDLVQLLPYHSYGSGKYNTLGIENKIQDHTPPSEEFMEEALELYVSKGLNASIS